MIIDFHCHLGDWGGWAITAEERVRRMDTYSVDKAVLLGGVFNEDWHEVRGSLRVSDFQKTNEVVGRALKAFPDRFIGFAWLNPLMPDVVDLLDHCVQDLGMRGIKLVPYGLHFLLYSVPVFRICEKAQKYGIPVASHTGFEVWDLPANIVALAAEFPEVDFVMLHMGAYPPTFWGINQAIEGGERHENIYLDTSSMPYPKKIKEAVNRIGARRVMFGTDNGGSGGNDLVYEIGKVEEAGLTEEEYRMVMGESAAELLGL